MTFISAAQQVPHVVVSFGFFDWLRQLKWWEVVALTYFVWSLLWTWGQTSSRLADVAHELKGIREELRKLREGRRL